MGKFALLVCMSEFRLKSFVVLIAGKSKSNHLGAQGTFKEGLPPAGERALDKGPS